MSSKQIKTLTDGLAELPFAGAIKSFLDYLTVEAGLAENTLLAYAHDLKGFTTYCKTKGIENLNDLKPDFIQKYFTSLIKADMAETTVKRALVAVKMLLKFAKARSLIQDDLTVFIETPKLWQRLPNICGMNKIALLLEQPHPEEPFYHRDKAILELLYATGLRAGELACLKVADLNLDIGYLRCQGKGGKQRVIPVGKPAINATAKYLHELRPKLTSQADSQSLFLSRTGRPLSRIEIWRMIKKYALRAGLGKNFTVHTLRHCFATHLLSGGADLRSLQEMLGHADIATTQIYTHVDQKRLRSIHKKYHPRP